MMNGLSELLEIIINALKSKPHPDNKKVNLWDMAIKQITEKDSIDGTDYNLIQDIVNDNIRKLKNDEIIIIWKETETGIKRWCEPEDLPIDSLIMDLQEEIMDEITTIAWDETENNTVH